MTKRLIFLLVFVLAPATSFAQTDEELQRAQGHFDEGASAYNGGQYADAITSFQKAFAVVPNALFLYNISLAQGKLGLLEEARSSALKATQFEGMDEKTTARNAARIPAFSTAVNATKIAKSLYSVAKSTNDPSIGTTVQTEKRFGALGITGIALTVVGAAGLVTAGVIANGISEDIPEYEAVAAQGNEIAYKEQKSDLQDRQTLGRLALGVGGGLAAIGVTLILIDVFNTETPRQTFYIGPTKDGAHAGVKFGF